MLGSEGDGASVVILGCEKGIAPALLDVGALKGYTKAVGRAASGVPPAWCLTSVALAMA